MSEIVVVYELDKPVATRGAQEGRKRPVRRVHAAPRAPGTRTATGPRTLCGKDTFAMEEARWSPPEDGGAPWYPPEHAGAVCSDCAAVLEI